MSDHPAFAPGRPNYARMWGEALRDSVRDAIADGAPALAEGHFLVQLCRNGPRVPMLIEREPHQNEYRAFVAGQEVEIDRVLITKGEPIGEARYRFLVAEIAWAARHDQSDPRLRPFQPVDVAQIDPVTP